MGHRSNGIPGFPYPNGGPPALTVAAPLGDLQLLCIMGSAIAAGTPAPDIANHEERDRCARTAVLRAMDILGHAAHLYGLGAVTATVTQAMRTGEAERRAALEAEQSHTESAAAPPDDRPAAPKIVGPDGGAP